MKQKTLLLLICVVLAFLLQFISCTDTDYDLDNLNKEAVFSPDGISMPVGSLEPMKLKKLLDDLEIENLYWNESGTAYIRESGTFDFTLPDIANMDVGMEPYNSGWNGIPIDGMGAVPPNMTFIDLPVGGSFPFGFSADLGSGWTIEIDSAKLQNCLVNIEVEIQGVNITDLNNDAKVSVEFVLSNHFVTADQLTTEEKITDIAKDGGYKISKNIAVSKYKLSEPGDVKIECKLKFISGTNTSVSTNSPEYRLLINTGETTPAIEYVHGKIINDQILSGNIDFSSLKDALDESDVLNFDRPALKLTCKTNLGVDFKLENINLKIGAQETSVPLLAFQKPEFSATENKIVETVYWLAKDEGHTLPERKPEERFVSFDFPSLFNEIPERIDYSLNLTSNDPEAYMKLKHQLQMEAAYELIVPLSFSKIKISLKDTIRDIFSEELIERIFNTGQGSGDVEIAAVADIFLKKTSSDLNIKVMAYAVNENGTVNNQVKIEVEPSNGLQYGKDQPFSVKIKKEDMIHMINVRHLALTFVLEGSNIEITSDDYILLKNLKIKKEGGVYFEF